MKWDLFLSHTHKIYTLRYGQALLGWDQETFMPSGAGENRAEIMAQGGSLLQELYLRPDWLNLLDELTEGPAAEALSAEQAACVREMRRDTDQAKKIPPKLNEELIRTASLAQQAWAKSRKEGRPEEFLPWLQKMIGLKKEQGAILADGGNSYDALLDQFEPGMTQAQVSALFEPLAASLKPLLEKVISWQDKYYSNANASEIPEYSIDQIRQQEYMHQLLERIGFSLEKGRLDASAHPFTEGVAPADVRLTTRYQSGDVGDALFSTLHEGGHGLYEQNFSKEWWFSPLGEAVSLGIHESQSRFWENMIGRSPGFWTVEWNHFAQAFPEIGSAGELSWLRHINRVSPSMIRVDADELTYNFHVMIRFELERDLFSGEILPADLNDAWNAKMQHYLGITPQSPAEGFLQDVHWSSGLFGYFPTYTLGNLYAAQLAEAAAGELGVDLAQLGQADLSRVLQWLSQSIHRFGRQFSAVELIEKATGKAPDSSIFLNYLEAKHSRLWDAD